MKLILPLSTYDMDVYIGSMTMTSVVKKGMLGKSNAFWLTYLPLDSRRISLKSRF